MLACELAWTERRDRLGLDASYRRREFHIRHKQRSRFSETLCQGGIACGADLIVPQVLPALQRELFEAVLADLEPGEELLNEVVEITMDGGVAALSRYMLPDIE